jgi:hypothetical protein
MPAHLSCPLLHPLASPAPSGSVLLLSTGTNSLAKPLNPVIYFFWQAEPIDPDAKGFDYSVF